MKKSLVLAMAMALGVSATAFAANPFSDLPAGHWAYGAVAKLAAAGIVDGYPDGTFKGDKTMTRYEMAQIVAKALAKGAIGADDKLVSEFADELDNLGVRVAKLEKNADNVKITGAARASYVHMHGSQVNGGKTDYESQLRTRLWFTGDVNDNWNYVGMIQNQQFFGGKRESGDTTTKFQRAYLEGNIGVVDVTAGRYNAFYSDGNVFDDRADAVELKVKSGQTYIGAAAGKMANVDVSNQDDDKKSLKESAAGDYYVGYIGGNLGNLHMEGTYLKAKDVIVNGMDGDDKIWTLGADYTAGKWNINAMYLKGDDDALADEYKGKGADDDGYVVGLSYAGADSAKPGTWGLYTKYYDQAAPTVIAHTMNGDYWDVVDGYGFKGYMVGGNLTVAKNMVATVEYFDLKAKGGENKDGHARTLWSELNITF